MKFWLIILAFPLFATVNEAPWLELFTGYRNDRIHWHHGIHHQKLRDLEYWENGLVLNVIHRDLSFLIRGAYGFNASNWTADGSGYFGYAVNLTADRIYKVILTPLIGYGGYYERVNPLRLTWYGFFFGGEFTVEPGGRFVLNGGYSYHLLHNRLHFIDLVVKMKGMGQSGWAQIDYLLDCFWRLGIGGQIHYFSSGIKARWTPVSGWAQIARNF